MTRKEIQFRKNQKAEMKEMLKDIKVELTRKLEKAFNCGAVPDDWKEGKNTLLARTVIDNFCVERGYKLQTEPYKKEATNIQLFL